MEQQQQQLPEEEEKEEVEEWLLTFTCDSTALAFDLASIEQQLRFF